MKPVTINELNKILVNLIAQGYGERIVQVSNDEEQNGFHPIWGEIHMGGDVEFIESVHKQTENELSINIA